MQLKEIQQVGDKTPDTHVFTLSCSCRNFINLGFDQGKEGFWVMTALKTIQAHAQAKHPEALTVGG
jgi:hypothetical protein